MRPKPATIANAPSVAEQRRLWSSDAVSADMLYGRGLDTLELLGDRHLGVTAPTRWRASSVPAHRCVRATTERTNAGKSPRSGVGQIARRGAASHRRMEIAIILVGREPRSSPSGVWSARTASLRAPRARV